MISLFAGIGLEGVVIYNRLMRLGLFVLAFACIFCGLDEIVFDLHYTKEFWTHGNSLGTEYQAILKRWAHEHHL